MGKLFGTDGIRGLVNEYPMTPEMTVKIGRAVAVIFGNRKNKGKIVVGKDTRISGDMLEYGLISGICSMGINAYAAGVLPTPAVACLTSLTGADAGIVISASHNPFYDNGIKIFNKKGYKLSDEKEAEIEQLILNEKPDLFKLPSMDVGRCYKLENPSGSYIDFLTTKIPDTNYFSGLKIVLDCSNGATWNVAPEIFSLLGANVTAIYTSPDGKNINDNCGSEHPEHLQSKTLDTGADMGLAFDGDGDRLIVVDERGKIATGDQILAVCAKYLKQKGRLEQNHVVSTVMSNMGLGVALKKMGIKHTMSRVGDRYVMEEMVDKGAVLGGEDSGHMIFLDYHTTGDGLFTALRLIEAMVEEGKPLSELFKIMEVFPQFLLNVNVKNKPDLKTIPDITDVIKSVEKQLENTGRVLVRYSGTQPLCRVMVEGPVETKIRQYCQQIADVIKRKLGN